MRNKLDPCHWSKLCLALMFLSMALENLKHMFTFAMINQTVLGMGSPRIRGKKSFNCFRASWGEKFR